MADVISGTEAAPRVARETQRFGTIVVVGGGCYGGYYVRQLGRAERAGAAQWRELVVVDRNPACRVASLTPDEAPPAMRLVTDTWQDFFPRYLAHASLHPADSSLDAVVPSPLMPHLMAEWIVARSRARWPRRHVTVEPLATPPRVPWQRPGTDGTHYVSFAEWMCPINCIEPPHCPATKGERSWSLPPTLAAYAEAERETGRPVAGSFVFHCSHRTHGVGMIDVREVLAADAAIADRAAHAATEFFVGTASHCHGALQRIVVGAENDGHPE